MRVFRSLEGYQVGTFPIVTIGTFDGVHLGHRAILSRLSALQGQHPDSETVVITFDPHPRKVLIGDESAPKLLQTPEEKIEKLGELGLSKVVIIPFTEQFSRLESADFIKNVLVDVIGVKQLVIGYDHRFGRNRQGGLEELRQAGTKYDFEVIEIPAQEVDHSKISSTKIRQALTEGDVTFANRLLGYAYSLTGTVIVGRQNGSRIGFPTANLALDHPDKLIPATGVYAVTVSHDDHTHIGMMNIGYRPTFGDGGLTLEVHILDFDEDLYGKNIRITFQQRLRDEIKFPNADALIAQLQQDKINARAVFEGMQVSAG
jgi:riboflavin kinase/FMN adenylyltransferase